MNLIFLSLYIVDLIYFVYLQSWFLIVFLILYVVDFVFYYSCIYLISKLKCQNKSSTCITFSQITLTLNVLEFWSLFSRCTWILGGRRDIDLDCIWIVSNGNIYCIWILSNENIYITYEFYQMFITWIHILLFTLSKMSTQTDLTNGIIVLPAKEHWCFLFNNIYYPWHYGRFFFFFKFHFFFAPISLF